MTALKIAEAMPWGTYGKGAVEAYEEHGTPLPKLTVVRLGDCNTSHLTAIQKNIEGVLHCSPGKDWYRLPYLAVQIILDSRKGTLCKRLLAIFSRR